MSPSKKAVFSSKTGIRFAANCSNYEARFMAAIPATVTTAGLSLAYKSQRKTVKRGGGTRQRGEKTEKATRQKKKKTERRECKEDKRKIGEHNRGETRHRRGKKTGEGGTEGAKKR